jgi:hypothetical protein
MHAVAAASLQHSTQPAQLTFPADATPHIARHHTVKGRGDMLHAALPLTETQTAVLRMPPAS